MVGTRISFCLIYVDHSVAESPEENVCEEAIEQAVREESCPRSKEGLPCTQCAHDEHRPKNNRYDEVKQEPVQRSQPEDSSWAATLKFNQYFLHKF